MDDANASPENPNSIPSAFRGLRILLLDSDAASLLDLAAKLEDYSYRVIALELPTIALSILEEHADRFDLVMADMNMKEMDCFKFIESVQLIKNFPIILMSADLRKDMVEEAMRKGACFFMNKPISPKSLMNVWQHVYRETKHETSKKNDEKEAESQGGKEKEDNALETEQVGDGNENDRERLVDKNKSTQLTEIRRRSSVSTANDETGEIKWKRTEDGGTGSSRVVTALSGQLVEADTGLGVEENQELTDFNQFSTGFLRLLQETGTTGGRENPHFQSLFPTRRGVSSSYNQVHFHAREKGNDGKEGQGS